MRRTIRLAFAFLVLAAAGGSAHATGLGASVAALDNQVRSLARLDALSIDVHLGPTTADITEHRSYDVTTLYAGGPVQLTFFESLTAPEGAAPPTITIGGANAPVATLAPAEADVLRRQLTRVLGDPAPLRTLGRSLTVTDAVVVAVPTSNVVDVQITMTVPLAALGTLQGIVLPLDWGRVPVGQVAVNVKVDSLAPLRALYSPYHELAMIRDGVTSAHATYTGRNVCTDFDLTLLTSSGDGLVHLDLLPFRYGAGDGGTFLALVGPDPSPVVGSVLPRDLVFVLDTSGSMSGAKLTQAQEALRGVLQRLRPADSFALFSFSDAVHSFEGGQAVAADADHVAAALAYVDGLQAAGGTNIYDALQAALTALSSASGHPRYVVFLTDGQPTVGTTSIDAIAAMAKANDEALGARLFSFGIGNDVNTVLLDRLARDSAGDVIYIRPDQSVAVAVQDFFLRIADPLLSNPTLDFGQLAAADVFPEAMPDLFAGQPVTLFGRYGAPGPSTVTLAGARNGQTWTATFAATLPDYALDAGFVPRVWALREVGRLLAEIKQGNADPALVAQVTALASRYGVATNFTGFVADANGDVALRYAGVPTAQTGSVAVDTSSALRDYGSGTAVPTASSSSLPVRYAADRTFAAQGGYLTDTALTAAVDPDVELTFASDRYFAFAAAEAAYGAGPLLAAGNNVRFELLGRTFRVTDPAALPRSVDALPAESEVIPDPRWRPMPGASAANATTTTLTGGTGAPAPVADRAAPGLTGRAGCACDAAGGDGRAVPAGLLLLALFARRAHRRARRPGLRGAGLPLAAFILAALALSACETHALDGHPTPTPDAGTVAVVSSLPPTCITAMASFTEGLRADLFASVGDAARTSPYDVTVDGVTLTAGYGQDLAMLATGFSAGAASIGDIAPDASATTLWFGGWRSTSSVRDALGFHAADQLWTALAGAPETRTGSAIVRTTLGRRAACRRDDAGGSLSIDCFLGGLIRVDAAESVCQQLPSPSP